MDTKELRDNQGVSQNKLAKQLGVSQATVSRWERGKNMPSSANLIALQDKFKMSIDEMLGRTNYATGNIEIKGEILSTEEKEMVDMYREMNRTQKDCILNMSKTLLRKH